MASKSFDPLECVPSSEILRRKLTETLTLAERFRILLEVAERIEQAKTTSAGPRLIGDIIANPSTDAHRITRLEGIVNQLRSDNVELKERVENWERLTASEAK
jgi:hypothetical protein